MTQQARTTDRRWLSLSEAGEVLGLRARTIRRMIARGEIRGYTVGRTRNVRVLRSDVEECLQPIKTDSGPEAGRAS